MITKLPGIKFVTRFFAISILLPILLWSHDVFILGSSPSSPSSPTKVDTFQRHWTGVIKLSSRWWFQVSFIFTPTWGNDPIRLIFFRWIETTNQIIFWGSNCLVFRVFSMSPHFLDPMPYWGMLQLNLRIKSMEIHEIQVSFFGVRKDS